MKIKVDEQVLLRDFSPFAIGGPAQYFTVVHSQDELLSAISFAKELKLSIFYLGKGSNCLFDDRGFQGLVIKNEINSILFSEDIVQVGAGVFLPYLCMLCSEKQLSGLEFAAAIPGTVGGALFMNASAHGQAISSLIQKVTVLTVSGDIIDKPKDSLKFGYRSSSFQKEKEIIVSVKLQLSKSVNVADRVKKYLLQRKETQPIGEKTLGSIFKNPSDKLSAGALIDQCGLKGLSIGGAKISLKHANFIVNEKMATFNDVVWLIEKIQQKVKAAHGIDLEKEIIVVPYGVKNG